MAARRKPWSCKETLQPAVQALDQALAGAMAGCAPAEPCALPPPRPPAPTTGFTSPSPVCALLLTMLGLTVVVVVGPLMVVVGPEMLRGGDGGGAGQGGRSAALRETREHWSLPACKHPAATA